MNLLTQRLSLICALALLLAGTLEVRAANITIDRADTRQNGGQAFTPRGGDTITVTKDGSITIQGGASSLPLPAILATDDNTISNEGKLNTRGGTSPSASRPAISAADGNTISNAGEINTTGPAAHGIDANDRNEITNSGSISTGGENADGIFAINDNEKITNSGSISTKGARADGIKADDRNIITNEVGGSISTEGFGADGIEAIDRNTITNSGNISTKGGGGTYGIRAGKKNTISNEAGGKISTEGGTDYGIGADDDNEITNSGSINTEGADARGIFADENNTIINSGSINTKGDRAVGIFAVKNNTITNEADASILTEGEGAAGIRMNRFNPFGPRDKITNHGRIETFGDGAAGIDVSKNSGVTNAGLITVINTDLITTTGANAHGIRVSNQTKITHSGRIQVSGLGSAGILAINGNTLTLSGSITSAQGSALHLGDNNTINHSGNDTLRAKGQNTPAVRLGDGNTLTNTGRIEATGRGPNAHGITGGSNNIINNSGTISARGGRAICFTGRNNTINLLSGSVLIGGLCGGARVNMTVDKAPAHSILWDGILARPKRGSGAPFFYNAQNLQLATYDIRALAASAGALADASGNVSRLMARPDLESSANHRSLIPTASGSAFWLHSSGSRAQYQGRGDLNPEFGHLALAAGYDLRLNTTQFGLLAGYGQGELRLEGEQRFKPGPSLFRGPLAAFYVRRDFGPFLVQMGLSGGALKHESSRLVNDNLAPNGLARAEARTRSWWLAPEARIGLRLDAGLMQLEPSFTARYAQQSIRGFTETGIRAPATLGQRKVELLETRLELKVRREVGPGRIAWKAGWQYRDDLNSIQAEVRLLGESQRLRLESGLGSSFYLGAEAEFELTPGLFLHLSGEAVSNARGWLPGGMASVYKAF